MLHYYHVIILLLVQVTHVLKVPLPTEVIGFLNYLTLQNLKGSDHKGEITAQAKPTIQTATFTHYVHLHTVKKIYKKYI